MTKDEKDELYESIISKVAKIVKNAINEYDDNIRYNELYNDEKFVKFIKKAITISQDSLIQTKRDILNTIKKLNEDKTTEIRDYILNKKSNLNSDITFELVKQTFDDLYEHHNDNYRELMMFFYSDYYKSLKELYHFRDWQFSLGETYDGVVYMDFLIPRDCSEIIIKDLRAHGMVERILDSVIAEFKDRIFKNEFSDAIDISDKFDGWTFIRFVPIKQNDCRKIIRENSKYVYHITDASNIQNIIKDGIQMNNISHSEVQPRVFLVVPNRNDLDKEPDDEMFDFSYYINVSLPMALCTYRIKDGTIKSFRNWKYAKVRINIDKIPSNVEFYWDIHSFPFAFFTENSIPASAIEDYEIKTLNII